MAYVDVAIIQATDPGDILTAAWCDQVRDNEEFLIDPPACSVYNSTAQTVATATASTLLADTERYDNDSMHSTVSQTSRITATTAGRYLLFFTIECDPDADGSRRVDMRYNGVDDYICFNIPASSGVSTVVVSGTRSVVLAAGDYMEMRVQHTAGNDLDVQLQEFGLTFLTRA